MLHVFLVLFSKFGLGVTAHLTALPRFSFKELDWQKFDKEFLNKRPVIIEGVTHCPLDFSLASILEVCLGSTKTDVYKMPLSNASSARDRYAWAGLGKKEKTTSLKKYVKRLQKGTLLEPTYAFGFDVPEHCPWALETMRMPPHFIGNFVSEWARQAWPDCDVLADPLAYLNNMYFSTNLHIDEGHATFYASMCEGQKLWRVVMNSDFDKHRDEFNPYLLAPGIEVKGKLAFAFFMGSFETWSSQSPLESMNLTVYEGIQEPGSVLYLPAGSPHAAKALTNHSVMVATNDYTFQDLEVLHSVCSKKQTRDLHPYVVQGCSTVSSILSFRSKVRQNKKRFGTRVVRQDTPFLEVYGCSSKAKLCKVRNRKEAWAAYCGAKVRVEL